MYLPSFQQNQVLLVSLAQNWLSKSSNRFKLFFQNTDKPELHLPSLGRSVTSALSKKRAKCDTYPRDIREIICDFHVCSVQWKAFNALIEAFRTSWHNMKAQQGLHCSTNQKHIHTEHMIKRFGWTQMSALGFILWVLLCCQTLYQCPPNSVWTQTAASLRQKTRLYVPTGYTHVWESHIHQNMLLFDMLMWERFKEVQNHNGNIYWRIQQDFYTGHIRLGWSDHKTAALNTGVNPVWWVLVDATWYNRSNRGRAKLYI